VTFLALFPAFTAALPLEPAGARRDDFFAAFEALLAAPLEAGFPAFRAGLAGFLAAAARLAVDLAAFLAAGLGPLLTPPALRLVAAFL
jgi:hypothetical protein